MNSLIKSKRISVVSQFWPPNFIGGGEISTYYVCKQLIKIGYKITVITPNPGKSKDFKFIKTIHPHWLYEPFEEKYFQKITTTQKLNDEIYWASDYYGAAFLNNKEVKKIATVRDYWPVCNYSGMTLNNRSSCNKCNLKNILKCGGMNNQNICKKITKTFRYLYNIPFRKSILPKFNHTIFISNCIAKEITSAIHLKNYSIIHNPISPEYMNKEIFRVKVNKKILFAGLINESKGISVLIKAMGEIVKKNKNILLLVAGDGNIPNYKKITNSLGLSKNIIFLNKISFNKIIDYYDKCDIVVNPSLWLEPFGRTIIEGMARKCIPIATNQGGPSEIITDRKTGFLFEKGNFVRLAQIINTLYQNPEKMKTIQEQARKFAIKEFSPQKIASNYLKVFKNL